MINGLKKYVPLKTIVAMVLDAAEKSQGDFDKVWVLAFRAYADLGFDIMFEPKTLRLPINGNKTVTLPSDYISWTKIGVINSKNEVQNLRINKSLTKWRDNNPNRISEINADVPDFTSFVQNPFYVNYFVGNWYTPLFGIGSGIIYSGECVVDEKNGVIVLSAGYKYNDIILEYISSPQADFDYEVETIVQEAVIAFCEWKLKLGSQQDYYLRKIEARRRLKPIQLQIMNDVIRKHDGYKVRV